LALTSVIFLSFDVEIDFDIWGTFKDEKPEVHFCNF